MRTANGKQSFFTAVAAATVLALGGAGVAVAQDAARPSVVAQPQLTAAAAAGTVGTAAGPVTIPVDAARELMITDLSVVEDALRTTWPIISPVASSSASATDMARPRIDPRAGAWTFGKLMTDMAGANDPSAFVLRWLEQWETDQAVNGFTVPARTQIRTRVIDPWLARSGGQRLDLTKAPFRLLAIVNRLDLRKNPVYAAGNAGEGRFVFGVLDQNGSPLPFTVILEYELPASTLDEVQRWARDWHALGSLPFGAPYNDALQAITNRFAGRGAAPRKVNGSAINQIRTNENALARRWELREFRLESRSGMLQHVTVKQTPDESFNNSAALAAYINANEAAIIAERHTVPAAMLGGASPEDFTWIAPRVRSADARHKFALNTCSGCHLTETGTPFLMVTNRAARQRAQLAGFLTGITVPDPVSNTPRTFNDLSRRAADLRSVLTATRAQLMVEAPRIAVH